MNTASSVEALEASIFFSSISTLTEILIMNRNIITKKQRMNTIGSGLIEIERFRKDYFLTWLKQSCIKTSIKFNLHVDATYIRPITHDKQDVAFKTSNVLACNSSDFASLLNTKFDKILAEESEFIAKGSGWTLVSIDGLQLRINLVNPLKGGAYLDLPKFIREKKAIINVKNKDKYCFKYSILTKYDTRSNKSLFNQKYFDFLEKKSGLDFKCIDFPTQINQIKKFERLNNVSVNVYSTIFPLFINNKEEKNHFDLFLINNHKTSHYCYIKDFSRFIRSQKTKNCSKLIICKRCFTTFGNKPCKSKLWGETGLTEHKKMCSKNELGRSIMFEEGKENKFIFFKSYKKTFRIPFVIYADFECILKPKQTNEFTETSKKPQVSKTYITHLHEIMSYAFYVKVDYNIISEKLMQQFKIPTNIIIYRGIDAAKKFIENMIDISKKINDIYQINVPMITLTEKEEKEFQIAKVCKICLLSFEENELYKVRDHCHITGKYRQCICFKCNFEITNPSFVPIFFHNLSYDSHFIIRELVYFIKTLGEYSDLYLKTDVAILTDVFENFRDLCLSTLSLDPDHHMTAPGFAFDYMLKYTKYTKVKLDKLTD
ncbi:hypothetical protein AGLY_017056 [Aphis glycines]|uniref:DNA-directed DNA polymerase n=1 Tax=Aphis glycines TaxID=307491 RepID=A0A6G0SW49_APHGL|nr:hypothetical protein AGLY_017056 [Aphis glycines]